MINGESIPVGLEQGTLNHLWQSTVVVLLVWILTATFRSNRASLRYALWMTASAKFLLPFSLLIAIGHAIRPISTATAPGTPVSSALWHSVQPYTLPTVTDTAASLVTTHAHRTTEHLWRFAFSLWIAGALVMLLSWLRNWLSLRAIARRARPIGEVAGVPLLQCEGSIEPGVFGAIRPRILIPKDLLERISMQELEAIYAHELCHVRRRDNLSAALHAIVHILFWFHPAVWLIRARLIDERERACDEHVVTEGSDAEIYAMSILNVCRFYVEAPAQAMAGVSGGSLKHRIERILDGLSHRELTRARKLTLAAAVVCVIGLPLTAGLMNIHSVHAQTEQEPSLPGAGDHAKAFDVATVRPSHLTSGCASMLPPGSTHYSVTCMDLRVLIAMAYGVNSHRVDGPSKELDRYYDINASTGNHPWQQTDIAPMLQTLLAERFHLKVHIIERPVDGFAMVVAKGGPRLKQTSAANVNEAQAIHAGQGAPNFIARGMVQGTAASLRQIASLLSFPAGAPVVDHTGLQGFYDVSLHFAPDDDKDSDQPGFFSAVEEQLGLKLQPAKVPATFLVVDHVDANPSLDQ
ncbi:M56 family metallopeptidase [Silvibacterium dinghuense]|uniref:TIGR03435 family protein n=1 Tax=Silvibacterium dinghuense TaxID=1560006 RepID=A0A4Q1SA31_9BACT|nr:M56 family metallopeptidase [Silvibacterium dinghuense]RXS93799.1 TIGR03435 family protein [Silvibacterium dinghuense]GGH07746.1 hypothetical protein GCM10011586_25070 [Silvibacterium dinghuense]